LAAVFGATPGGDDRVEVGGERRVGGQDPGVVRRQSQLIDVARAALCGQLREPGTQLGDPLRRRAERRQVGLREVAIVVRLLLRALDDRPSGGLVPAARLLHERLAALQRIGMALDLERERPLKGAEAVEVLHLDLGPERRGADRADADVALDPHAPRLHVGVAGADRARSSRRVSPYARACAGERRSGSVTISISGTPARLKSTTL
jgi:hypothetical protein